MHLFVLAALLISASFFPRQRMLAMQHRAKKLFENARRAID